MKKKKNLLVLMAAVSFIACSCNDDDSLGSNNVENVRKEIALSRSEKAIVEQSTDFAFRLLQVVDGKEDKEQLLLSPLSASFALSMAANGADGDTRQEILGTLGFAGFTMDEVNELNRKLVTGLTALDNAADLSIANSVWMNDDFEALGSYKKTVGDFYDALLSSIDFGTPEALDRVNGWCSEKTQGRIPRFLDRLDDSKSLMLLNALYFKGGWTRPFSEKNTVQDVFHGAEDRQVQYMVQKNNYPYAEFDDFAVAGMPYGNEAFSMFVLLPDEGVGISDCLSRLDSERWNAILSEMKTICLSVKLPKFKLENNEDLKEVLWEMGISKAFTWDADFSNLSDESLFVTEVRQANYFGVDEKGVEAAGVTSIEFGLTAGPDGAAGETEFHVTRPFLFVLQEKSSGTILFLGKVG